MVDARAAVSGTIPRLSVERSVRADVAHAFGQWHAVAPKAAEGARAKLEAGVMAQHETIAEIGRAEAAVNELRGAILERGDLRRTLDQTRERIKTAESILTDPGCFTRPDTELARLSVDRADGPTMLANLQSAIQDFDVKIEHLVEEGQFDLEAMLRQITTAARQQPVDQRIVALDNAGYL